MSNNSLYINNAVSCLNESQGISNASGEQLFCKEFKIVSWIYFSISLLSLTCCVIVFVTYWLFPRLKGYSSNIFLIRFAQISHIFTFFYLFILLLAAVCRTSIDLLIALGHIVSFLAHFFDHVAACQVLGVYFEFLFFSANLWYGVLAYDLIKAIRNPFG